MNRVDISLRNFVADEAMAIIEVETYVWKHRSMRG